MLSYLKGHDLPSAREVYRLLSHVIDGDVWKEDAMNSLVSAKQMADIYWIVHM
jgi:hypothetical protein